MCLPFARESETYMSPLVRHICLPFIRESETQVSHQGEHLTNNQDYLVTLGDNLTCVGAHWQATPTPKPRHRRG